MKINARYKRLLLKEFWKPFNKVNRSYYRNILYNDYEILLSVKVSLYE